MFSDPDKRARLLALVKVYFARGGQEMQINAVSRAVLADAMAQPQDYQNLVVRVSGFSAYFTQLDPEIQADILQRTEQA
jgi:pyruvate-formate lyase